MILYRANSFYHYFYKDVGRKDVRVERLKMLKKSCRLKVFKTTKTEFELNKIEFVLTKKLVCKDLGILY